MKAGWRDAPLALRDLAMSNVQKYGLETSSRPFLIFRKSVKKIL